MFLIEIFLGMSYLYLYTYTWRYREVAINDGLADFVKQHWVLYSVWSDHVVFIVHASPEEGHTFALSKCHKPCALIWKPPQSLLIQTKVFLFVLLWK